MTRIKSLFAAVVASAIVAVVPASAQTIHVAGAGSSAQWLTAALGSDYLALNQLSNVGYPTGGDLDNTSAFPACTPGDLAVYHWSKKSGGTPTVNPAYVVDSRSGNINPEPGNVWIVWTAACGTLTAGGASGVQDIWVDISVDSTVGVRSVLAQEPGNGGNGSTAGIGGAQIGINTADVNGASNAIGANALWADDTADVTNLPNSVYCAIGTGITNSTISGSCNGGAYTDVHVNVGLTDIDQDDALFATTRALATRNATLTGLGYQLITGKTTFGSSILTAQGTGTEATPEVFALAGSLDPITGELVGKTDVTPIGAAPVIFGMNNGGASSYPTNLISGVLGTGASNGSSPAVYPLANLFDGTTACDTSNPAFSNFTNGPTVFTINPILREPLSGTMNATEWSLFRTTGNSKDSQEVGATANPLSTSCASGGSRYRAIGTGEVVGALNSTNTTSHGNLGYFFWGFSNGHKLVGSTYNYMDVDGIDPFYGYNGMASQPGNAFPNCVPAAGAPCPSSLWTNPADASDVNESYLSLRNGSYPVWSIYRWVSYDCSGSTDPNCSTLGPVALAASTQQAIDTTVADYVPFYTSNGSPTGGSDGLSVYHSHWTVSGLPKGSCGTSTCTSVVGNNGTPTAANGVNGGNTLGVGDNGADMGGVIEGPYGTSTFTAGYVTDTGNCIPKKGWLITHKTNAGSPLFSAKSAWEGQTITIGGVNYTVASPISAGGGSSCTVATCTPTTTQLWVGANPTSTSTGCTGAHPPAETTGLFYIINEGTPPAASTAATDDLLSKRR